MTRTESTRAMKLAIGKGIEVNRHRYGSRREWAIDFPLDRTIYEYPEAKRHIIQISHGTVGRDQERQEARIDRDHGQGWHLVAEAKLLLGRRTWKDYGIDMTADGRTA